MRRAKEIDILKAIGIVLMIMGHQYYGAGFDHWIHAFHMPMFFLISGFLFKKHSIKRTIVGRCKSLLIPYLFFAILHLAIICCVNIRDGVSIIASLERYLYHLLLFNHKSLPICGAIWFLTALFVLDILYRLIDDVPNDWLRLTIVVAVTALGVLLSAHDIILPFSVNAALVGTGLYYVGNQFRKTYEQPRYQGKLWIGIAGMCACTIPVFMNGLVNVRLSDYANPFLFFFNAILMTFFLQCVAEKIAGHENWFVKELSFIGQNSIVYLGFNQLVLIFLKNIRFENTLVNTAYKIVALIICLMVLHLLACLLTKTRLRVLLGKW